MKHYIARISCPKDYNQYQDYLEITDKPAYSVRLK